jgi:hypothetical protein
MIGTEDTDTHGHQRGELIPGPSRITRLPHPPDEVLPGGQGFRVFGAEHPLSHGH